MKLYLTKMPPFGYDSGEFFTINKWYEGDLTPTIYDPNTMVVANPQTLQPVIPLEEMNKMSPSYVVKCDDGFIRNVHAEYFITQEEYRERKLNELDI